MHTDTTTATRPEVTHDVRLLELLTDAYRAEQEVTRRAGHLVSYAGHHTDEGSGIEYRPATWACRRSRFVVAETEREATVEDARPFAESIADPTTEVGDTYARKYGNLTPESAAAKLDEYDLAIAALATARSAVAIHEADYTGWSRFWLVTTSAGHVHSSTSCSTCRPTTGFAPVPSLSGLDESAAVEAIGETLCTVCFPSAPAKPSKVTQAQAVKLIEEGEASFLTMRAKANAKRR